MVCSSILVIKNRITFNYGPYTSVSFESPNHIESLWEFIGIFTSRAQHLHIEGRHKVYIVGINENMEDEGDYTMILSKDEAYYANFWKEPIPIWQAIAAIFIYAIGRILFNGH